MPAPSFSLGWIYTNTITKNEYLATDSNMLDALIRDDDASTKSKQYFIVIKLMKTFRKHMAVTPRDLKDMRDHWTRSFPGYDSEMPCRFNKETQRALNRNWDSLEAHLAGLHKRLIDFTRELETEAREARRDVNL